MDTQRSPFLGGVHGKLKKINLRRDSNMKKKLVASLAAAMVLGIAGTSFAATNPFTDVPAKHWSYDAVTKLANAGIVDGYGDGTFKGDKVITRYEMAQIVAKAMAHSDKANAEQKAAIDKLSVEFASELEGLNVRVTSLESKTDNVKWGGEVRERFDSVKQTGSERNTSASQSYVDMWATAQINSDWVGKAEYESSKHLTNGDGARAGVDGSEPNTTRVYAQGHLFGAKTTVGKFNPFTGYGLVVDDSMTGATFEVGNVLKARVGYGKYAGNINSSLSNNWEFTDSPTYAFGELDYSTSKVTNLKAVYHNLSDITGFGYKDDGGVFHQVTNQDSFHIFEAGFDTQLTKDWALMGTYSKSSLDVANQDNKGYLAQLTYKAADLKKQGSYDIYTNYRNVPEAAQLDSTWDYNKGVKGLTFGFDYVPANNIKVNAFYLNGKNLITKDDTPDTKVYRAQVEFFF
jgi:hypothetical protein